MQLTPNYKLKKPEETDPIDILDLNDNTDIIDAELKKRPAASGGDISEMTVKTLEEVKTEFPVPVAGESTKTFLGKIKKFCEDFNTFKTGIMTLGHLVDDCVTNRSDLPLAAAQGKVLMDMLTRLNSDFEKLYETVHPEDLYLYNNGNEYSNGFTFHSNTGWPTGSKTGAYLKVNYPQNSHVSYGNWNFDEGIDLTYYKHIVVQVYVSLNNSLYVGIKCGSLYSTRTITSSGTYTFDLDITSLSGTFVPYFYSENAWAITVAEVHFISMLLTK